MTVQPVTVTVAGQAVTVNGSVTVTGGSLGSWSNVTAGTNRLPTFTPVQSVYPNSLGIQFWYNGQIDLRGGSARPNGYDATGPNEGSTYHIYPALTLNAGDVLQARWVDKSGSSRVSVHTVGSTPPPPPPPPPSSTIPDPNNPVGAALESLGLLAGFPAPSNTGCRVPVSSLTVYNGEYIMSPGEILTNRLINGNIRPKAGCVVRDCVIRFDHNYGIDVRASEVGGSIPVASQPVFEYVTVDGVNATPFHSPCYSEGNSLSLRWCKFVNHGAPVFMMSNSTIRDCYIEGHRYDGDIHKEAIFHNGGTNNLIQGNTLIGNGSGTSAALALYGEQSAVSDMRVFGNLMASSQGYVLYTGSLSYKPFPNGVNVDFIGNRFLDLVPYNPQWDNVGWVTGSKANGVWSDNLVHNGPNAGNVV